MLLLCKTITSNKSSFFVLWQIGVIIMHSDKTLGKYTSLPKTYGTIKRLEDVRVFKSTEDTVPVKYLNFEDIVTISNAEYPEKDMAHIVEETKKIIQSRDKALRQQIKIDESYDFSYLEGKNHKLISSIERIESNQVKSDRYSVLRLRSSPTYESEWNGSSKDEAPSDELCRTRKRHVTPKFLSHYYIINTPNFEQTIKLSRCESEKDACGSPYKNQVLGYKRVCTQGYKRIELIAHPANKEFNVTNQELLSMRVQSDCKCSLIRS